MDSDSDGIFDRKELDFGTDPYNKDTDGDGNDDLEEIMYGSDPLDENDLLPEDVKYAIAIYKGEDNDVKSFTFTTDIKAVDILLMVDESGGMAGEVDALKNEIKTHIIDFVETEFPTLGFAAYGLATFGYETMYEMVQTMTLDNDEIQSAVNMLDASQSNELITEALYQATTGEGIEGHYYVNVPGFGKFEHQDVNVPGQNCNGKLGKIGGACFREKSWPIYVVVTDEAFTFAPLEAESGPGDTILWEWSDPEPHSVEETLAVMNNLGAKFIGIDTGFDDEPPVQELNLAQEDLDYFAQNTGSFYGSNEYSFIYHSPNEDGSGIGGVIGNAVVDLLRNINMDVTVIGVSDDTCNGIPAGEFISEIRTIYADPADWISGMDIETFYNVVPGTILRYDIHFGNDFCENTSDEPMMFELTPTAQGNGSYLSEGQKVFIIVP
jgi:hypothetical protein